jgi:DNA-binding Xre family transcriptional regulator
MRISYTPLWELLKRKGMSKKELIFRADIAQRTAQKMANNEPISISTLLRICTALDCGFEDVIKTIPDMPLSEQEN